MAPESTIQQSEGNDWLSEDSVKAMAELIVLGRVLGRGLVFCSQTDCRCPVL